jgi:hypothetical protein
LAYSRYVMSQAITAARKLKEIEMTIANWNIGLTFLDIRCPNFA